ncbi:hypothetical protein chiPu_0023369 [Chiloscyllium punctatum]|uniref:Uncharacterized protein n=1 Tax=Chiloscyllium punctatum TaxID=137246 RepID=A0A401T975_CHIPU|nr:hypothetical protein [Chiloscyllium punctatum]
MPDRCQATEWSCGVGGYLGDNLLGARRHENAVAPSRAAGGRVLRALSVDFTVRVAGGTDTKCQVTKGEANIVEGALSEVGGVLTERERERESKKEREKEREKEGEREKERGREKGRKREKEREKERK